MFSSPNTFENSPDDTQRNMTEKVKNFGQPQGHKFIQTTIKHKTIFRIPINRRKYQRHLPPLIAQPIITVAH